MKMEDLPHLMTLVHVLSTTLLLGGCLLAVFVLLRARAEFDKWKRGQREVRWRPMTLYGALSVVLVLASVALGSNYAGENFTWSQPTNAEFTK